MTTAVFTNLGSTIGSNIGSTVLRNVGLNNIPILSGLARGQFRRAGSFIGGKITEAIFGVREENKIRGPRLTDLTIQTSTYGDVIPIVFGRVKLAGNIIWARPVKEIAVTTEVSGGGKGGTLSPVRRTETRFQYKSTFAICLCEGEIANIERVWADNELVNLADLCASYSLYKGDETQLPDPIIESFEGINKTPSYRGLAYIVFEDFDITSFGNRIPNLSFEVNRPIKGSFNGVQSVEELVTGVNIIPGSGEFVYDTTIQTKVYGVFVNDTFIQRGGSDVVNMNNSEKKADILISIDQLESSFPNLEWVSIVCAWFASSLDANTTTIEPRVEYISNTITQPDLWSVGSYNRNNTIQATLDTNGNPIYGGTPSDQSILRLVTELKSRGYKVMFYPMVFVDQIDKPWRGNLTTSAANIPNFFTKTKGYNEFILHYANLLEDEVDAFIIGSEMKDLTKVQNGSNAFLAVNEFVSLAASVKTIMGSTTKLTYAADWSEYHSVNGWYNMDPLWASPNIDMIGIDAYFPLTDRSQDGIYNLQEVIDGWTNGEGYDWYYTDPERTNQASLSAPYAWKNIEYWWSHTHTNPNSVVTSWVPESKKIWFTEFGFPSVDGATNQPNVFYNPESVSGALPYHSQGLNDFTAQRLGIEATLLKWQASDMVEEKLLWTWDGRPYPFWPDLNNVWGDGKLWSKGHWVNGKLGGASLTGIVAELSGRVGIASEDIDVGDLQKIIDGYVLNTRISSSNAISKLTDAMFFSGVESDGILKFKLFGKEQEIEISEDDLIKSENESGLVISYIPETYLPSKVDVNFISRESNYLVSSTSDGRDSIIAKQIYENNIPMVLTGSKAKTIAEISLADIWAAKKNYNFSLPLNFIKLDIGDIVKLNRNNGDVENIKIEKITFSNNRINISGRSFEKTIFGFTDYDDYQGSSTTTIPPLIETTAEIMDISSLPGDDLNKAYIRFAVSGGNDNWIGAEIFYSVTDSNYQSLGAVQSPAVMGNSINAISDANSFIWDEGNELEVFLLNGELASTTNSDVLNGSNIALLGNEIIQFRTAEFIAENHYKLKGLLRGRLGTENKTSGHVAGERFILLNNLILRAELPKALIGSSVNFKVVSFGQGINDVAPIVITYKGQNLIPYALAHFEAIKQVSGDIDFSWIRRSREFSAWRDYVDMPLSEATEKYNISILNNTDQVVREIEVTASAFSYTASMQTTDFGSSQTTVKAKLYQISENVGIGTELQKTFNF